MNITLSQESAQIVQTKMASGQYPSAVDVVNEALHLLADRDRSRREKLEELRQEIDRGIDQLERGESRVVNDQFVQERLAEGRKRLAERRSPGKP
jgi:antitoxin ParD1/3/4